MPYKANEARRHKIPRARYKVTNWPEYDKALQQRGSLTVWVTPEARTAWQSPHTGQRGRPRTYSDVAIATGHPGSLRFDPAHGGSVLFAFGNAPTVDPAFFGAIPRRQSTRADYESRQVSAADLQMLTDAAALPGVNLVLITDRPRIKRVRELVVAGNTVQMGDAAFMQELKAWLRFNPREAIETGDGLFSASSGHPTLPTWLGLRMFDGFVTANSENDMYARQVRSSAGVAVFVSQQGDPDHWVRAGRACQRFALQATALGLKHAFVNQPVEVAKMRPELASLVGLPGRRPDIVMRFGYGPTLPFSARRPLQDVLALQPEAGHTIG